MLAIKGKLDCEEHVTSFSIFTTSVFKVKIYNGHPTGKNVFHSQLHSAYLQCLFRVCTWPGKPWKSQNSWKFIRKHFVIYNKILENGMKTDPWYSTSWLWVGTMQHLLNCYNRLEREVLLRGIGEKISFCSKKVFKIANCNLKELGIHCKNNVATLHHSSFKALELHDVILWHYITTLCRKRSQFHQDNHLIISRMF